MGPLQGLKILEIAGIGPTQFAGMLLADMGATVLRIERAPEQDGGVELPPEFNLMNRSRSAIVVDLKAPAGARFVLDLCRNADALFEGFRPGVMERLGLGPDECRAKNTALVYGRMTGWGQDGPLASAAGHDANYAALSGALGAIGERDGPPVIPLNLVADFGGGGAYLALGLVAALLEARQSGKGQVVDAAMVDGAASLMTLFYGLHAGGMWRDQRGMNFLDGGAPFYRCYETKDGGYMAVAAIEPRFFRNLLDVLGDSGIDAAAQYDQRKWPEHVAALAECFRQHSRDAWCKRFEGTDACVSPVLSLAESPSHPHNQSRQTFVEVDGVTQPGPAPRFSRTPSEIRSAPRAGGRDNAATLGEWGFSAADVATLEANGVLERRAGDG